MNVYLSGNSVTSVIDLNDDSGAPLVNVDRVFYRVVDSEDNELVEETEYKFGGEQDDSEEEEPEEDSSLEQQDETEESEPTEPTEPIDKSQVTIVTDAEVNTLAEETFRDIRVICLKITTTEGGTEFLEYTYGISVADPLEVGVNSFVTYRQAQRIAMDIPKLNNWEKLSAAQRISALMEARTRICRLSFDLGKIQFDMTRQNYEVQAAGKPRVVQVGEIFGVDEGAVNLSDLTKEEFEDLPEAFRKALAVAQVAEADDILEVDSIAERRRQGLILETIGEVKQMFSSILPSNSRSISSKAAGYLSRYLASGKKLARA